MLVSNESPEEVGKKEMFNMSDKLFNAGLGSKSEAFSQSAFHRFFLFES